MIKSRIELKNGKPLIVINDEYCSPLAYTTYFEECGKFSDFIKNGYKMYFVNVSFSNLPINNITGFSPFITGVFEDDEPSYIEFDNNIRRILSECHDAMIFPRINITMPLRWINENISETVDTPTGKRESFCSDLFYYDGALMLKQLVSHIRSSDYAHRIAGYQLCGGTTQEWIHHDLAGSFSPTSIKKFSLWLNDKYGITDAPCLSKDDLYAEKYDENVSRYGEFCCETAAKTVEYFSKVLKEYINKEQIVGVFYGYHAFVNDYLWGLHGMRFIIDSPYIDFFSSPSGYDDNRKLGIDWSDMIASESLKQHGKLYFVECDVRTHLTRRMQDSRPGKYPDDIYNLTDSKGNRTVWCGPETLELSVSALRKTFIHQLTKSSGVWWFDMWGGWYHSREIMAELKKMKLISENSISKNSEEYPSAETVMFIDERAYLNNPRGSHFCHSANITRSAMGNTGIPFDLCMVEDAEKVIHKYKAAIFTAPIPSECRKTAVELCKSHNIPFVQTSVDKHFFTSDELRNFLVSSGVHCYNADGCVVYAGNGYFGIHSSADGDISINIPENFTLNPLLGITEHNYNQQKNILTLNKYDTVLFEFVKTD